MKRIIVLFVLPLFPLFSYAQVIQQKNVPAVVLNSFQLKFSNATDINWKLEKGNYHVSFEANNKDNELVMNDKGNILKHQQDLYVSEIPKVVLETIKSKIAFFDVSDADRIEEGSKISYNINLKINENTYEFITNEMGILQKYTKELKGSELPPTIVNLIKTKYGSLDIDEAIFTEESGKITYLLKGEINDMDHVFMFDDKATLLIHEQDLRNSEVPVLVMNAAKAAYVGFEIRDADLTEESGQVIYKLKMSKSKEKVSLILNQDGKILEFKNN